ncbi:MAG: hypothetical protein OXG74_07500 [Acidobacteria bacterium]|nr:hypothetical protein [Acidobacteriota bacterium]
MPLRRSTIAAIVAFLAVTVPLGAADSPGCSAGVAGLASAATPGTSVDLELAHGGLVRSYRLHLPAHFDAVAPAPLWLHVHGYTGSARHSDGWTGLSELSDREGFVLVFPQSTSFEASLGPPGQSRNGTITSWNDLACSAPLNPEAPACREGADPYPCPPECGTCGRCNWCSCHDDVAYVAALIDHLAAELCIDTDRVFASGYSNGGMFVHRLGCALDDRLAAVAPMHGYLARGFNCAAGASGPSMLLVGGTADRTVPIDGSFASDGYIYTSQHGVAEEWAESQSCSGEPTAVETRWDGRRALSCVEHPGCAGDRAVRSCSWDGAHVWPRDDAGNFGGELLWDFFSEAER